MIANFFLHVTGADNVSGPWYGFWSGFGSDIMEFAIFGAVYKKLNCHVSGCWRLGLHKVNGTPYITCRKHHPATPKKVTHLHVVKAHKKYIGAVR